MGTSSGRRSVGTTPCRPSILSIMVTTMLVIGFTLPLSVHFILRSNDSSWVGHRYHPSVAIAKPLEGGVPVRTTSSLRSKDGVRVRSRSMANSTTYLSSIERDAQQTSTSPSKNDHGKHPSAPGTLPKYRARDIEKFREDSPAGSSSTTVKDEENHRSYGLEDTHASEHGTKLVPPAYIRYSPQEVQQPDWNFIHQDEKHQLKLAELTERAGKVYCAIPSMYTEKKLKVWSTILQTYGGRCDQVTFFVDPIFNKEFSVPVSFHDASSNVTAKIVELPMVRESGPGCREKRNITTHIQRRVLCKNIWEKVWRMWVWVYRNDLNSADWFVKVDDDTFMFPENIKVFVLSKGWKGSEPHYFGHRLMHGKYMPLIAGGAAMLSQKALRLVGPVYESMPHEYKDHGLTTPNACLDRDGPFEEITTSLCLSHVAVEAEDSADGEGREKVLTFPVVDHFAMIRSDTSTGWYWKNKEAIKRGGEYCCDTRPMAFHRHKNPIYLRRINQLIYSRNSALQMYKTKLQDELQKNENTLARSVIQQHNKYPVKTVLMEVEYYLKVRKNLIELVA